MPLHPYKGHKLEPQPNEQCGDNYYIIRASSISYKASIYGALMLRKLTESQRLLRIKCTDRNRKNQTDKSNIRPLRTMLLF